MIILYILTFVAPILILSYLSIKPQKRFIKRYQERVNTDDFHGPSELNERYKHHSMQFFIDAPRMMKARLELFNRKDYHDKELNKLAKEVRLYFLAQILILVGNFFLFSFFISKS